MQTSSSPFAPPAVSTATTHFTRPTYLMCPPEWYDVNYVINPWMAGNLHRPSRDLAFAQWRTLFDTLRRFADVRMLPARRNCPDMTFVGHTAVVQHGLAAISSFAHRQRQCEEQPLRQWFQDSGFLLWETPRETAFEGEGDALFDPEGTHLWVAHGPRTCQQSHAHLSRAWHVPVHSLHLIDPRFYHLDTCFAPLAGGHVLYFPDAFDTASLRLIEQVYPADRRITVGEREAAQFSCNVLSIGNRLVTGSLSAQLANRLESRGFVLSQIDLSQFLQGGGSAKSLALRISDSTLSAA